MDQNVTITPEYIRKLLRQCGYKIILTYYDKRKNLSDDLKRLVIQLVTNFLVNINQGKKPSVPIRRQTAIALQAVFRDAYPDINVLLGSNSNYGTLGRGFGNAIDRYQKLFGDLEYEGEGEEDGMEVDMEGFLDMEMHEEEEDENEQEMDDASSNNEEEGAAGGDNEEFAEELHYLKNVIVTSTEWKNIERKLTDTFEYRRRLVENGDVSTIFNLYLQDPRFVLFEFGLMFPEKEEQMMKLHGKLKRFIDHLPSANFRSKLTNFSDEVDMFESVIYLLGTTPGGASNAIGDLVRYCPENTPLNEIEEMARSLEQPFIIIRQSEPFQYLLSFDQRVIPLNISHFDSFAHSFDCLFKLLYVFHIKFPNSLKKFYNFFARAIYSIPGKPDNSHKVLDLVNKFKNFENQEDTSEEDTSENNTADAISSDEDD